MNRKNQDLYDWIKEMKWWPEFERELFKEKDERIKELEYALRPFVFKWEQTVKNNEPWYGVHDRVGKLDFENARYVLTHDAIDELA